MMNKVITARNFRLLVLASFAISSIYLVAILFSPQLDIGILTFDHPAILLYYNLSAIFVLFFPEIFKKITGCIVSDAMLAMYSGFVFAGLFLGTALDFYALIPIWDKILHFFSGIVLGILGFAIIDLSHRHFKREMSVPLATLFALCFAMAAGKVWEIYEFILDSLLGTNTQRWADNYGVPFVGQEALMDTMLDMILNSSGAILIVIWGYHRIKRNGWPESLRITKAEKNVK